MVMLGVRFALSMGATLSMGIHLCMDISRSSRNYSMRVFVKITREFLIVQALNIQRII